MGTPSKSAGRELEPAESFSHKTGEWVRAGLFAGAVMAPIFAVKGVNAVVRSKTAKSAAGVVGHVARAALEVGVAAPLRYISRPHEAKYATDLTARYAGQDLKAAKYGVLDIANNMKGGVTSVLQSLGDAIGINGPKDAHN